MAVEKFANRPEALVDSAFSAGGTSLVVDDASDFPTTGTFRVLLGNASGTIFRVDSVSTNTFTGAVEAFDDDADVGDTVKIVATQLVAERFLQSPASGEIHAYAGASGADRYGPIWKTAALDQSGWSWVNQGSATVTQAGAVFLEGPTQAGRNSRARVTTAPSTPYTITARLNVQFLSTSNFSWAGLCWRQSSSGKLIEFYRLQNGAIEGAKETDPNTFSAAFGSSLALAVANGMDFWLRLNDTGTNLVTSYSFDGVNFTQHNSEGRTVFMTTTGPDQVGIFVAGQGSASIQKMSILSWLVT